VPLDLDHTLAGEAVQLLSERALYWPARRTLFVTDLHWGKTATFRAHAVPLPGGTTAADLARLDAALLRTGARQLLILGDLFHAREGRTVNTLTALAAWRARWPLLSITLVRGNHDQHAGDPPDNLAITCVDAPHQLGPFVLHHHPPEGADPAGYWLAGHLHPVALLSGVGRQRLRLPCFALGGEGGLLPAFGSFTGGAPVSNDPRFRLWVVADDEVIPIAPAGSRPGPVDEVPRG